MKVVIAPDKFAGTLTAAEAAHHMRAGWLRARPDDEVVTVPMADGGEGTLAVVEQAVDGAQSIEAKVADALGRPQMATWVLMPDGRALIEVAQACGISQLSRDELDPLAANSYGVGQLMQSAVENGAKSIVVGLGGSATVDGGLGMLQALGHRFLDRDGEVLPPGGASLGEVHQIQIAEHDLAASVVIASDVLAPLLGKDGAARVFGPQKGASPSVVERLERGMEQFADRVEETLGGRVWRDRPAAGAAGGLGFSLLAFYGARVLSGAEAVGELVDFDAVMQGAGVFMTGEGRLDRSSFTGKAPDYILRRAKAQGAIAIAIAGRIVDNAGDRFDYAADLGEHGMARPRDLVEERAHELASRCLPTPAGVSADE